MIFVPVCGTIINGFYHEPIAAFCAAEGQAFCFFQCLPQIKSIRVQFVGVFRLQYTTEANA